MKGLLLLSVLVLAIPGTARTSQAQTSRRPAGPTLDFTLNYLNAALSPGASLTLNGTKLKLSMESSDNWKYDVMYLVGARAYLLSLGNNTYFRVDCAPPLGLCDHFYEQWKTDVGNKALAGQKFGFSNAAGMYNISFVTANRFKLQDCVNAMNHLIVLVSAEYDARVQQERRQNQSDPFANPR